MPTLSDMIDEVKVNLQGYTLRQDRITYVANAGGLSTSTTSVTIGSSSNLAKGVIEIDDELVLIDSYDKTSNTLTIMPGFGRGYQHSTAATHNQYAPVILSPAFPRVSVKQAINDTIASLYPKLWANATTTITYNPAVTTYALPAGIEDITTLSWQAIGPSKEWIPINNWRMDPMANTTAFPSGSSVSIHDRITPGRTIQVAYRKAPEILANSTDEFTTVSGLPASCRDVVTLGAAYKMLSYVDAGRVNLTSAEADAADSKLPSAAGTNVSKYIFALYNQRLNEESSKLSGQYPIRPHRIG
jgi:hypothetical protein